MQGVARNFFTLAMVYAVCGMALGLSMSISHDHSHMPVHAGGRLAHVGGLCLFLSFVSARS